MYRLAVRKIVWTENEAAIRDFLVGSRIARTDFWLQVLDPWYQSEVLGCYRIFLSRVLSHDNWFDDDEWNDK